ncbi:hypothetical protein GYA49_04615 [Candidatus Beckwithbacteria bacterium]|nr:hypothetical protein [Candidatus Beckwithbacteria bacterium]
MTSLFLYFLTLTLTIVIEILVGGTMLGWKNKLFLTSIVLVNLITHPLLNYILYLDTYLGFLGSRFFATVMLEALVVLVEWRLLVFAMRSFSVQLFKLSLIMNVMSYLLGSYFLVIFAMIYNVVVF